MKRRSFLRKGLFGGGLLALAGTGLFVWPARRGVPARAPLRVFDEREFAVLAAVASRTVRQPGADPVAIAMEVDAEVALLPLEVRSDLKKLMVLFENALTGLVFDGRIGPFTRLGPEDQDHVLKRWRDSRLSLRRAGYQSLRKLTLGAFYRSPASWPLSGYPGPPTVVLPK